MPLTLAITDNQNGTVNIVVTGSQGGDVEIYKIQAGDAAWAGAGLAIGDDNFDQACDTGYWFFYARDTVNNEATTPSSRIKVLDLTSEDAALHYQCLLAVQAKIQDLLLADLDSGNVLIRKLPNSKILEADTRTVGDSAAAKLPGILICPGNQEKISGGTNERDDIGYPVSILVLANDEHKDKRLDDLSKYLRWREQIERALTNQRLLDVEGQPYGRLEADPIIDKRALIAGTLATALTIRYTIRRSRGII